MTEYLENIDKFLAFRHGSVMLANMKSLVLLAYFLVLGLVNTLQNSKL